MGSFSATALNAMLDAELATVYIKLHTGDPGAAGTSNAATNTTRKLLTLAAASAGSKVTTAAVTWTSVPASETYSHASFWTDVSAGTFLGSDDLSASSSVLSGNNFTIPSGSISLSIS